MSRSTYRAAIVGTGAIADAHATALRNVDGRVELVAVADVDADRAAGFARRWGIQRYFASLDELLLEEVVDLVHVCVPPQVHADLTKSCLAANASVLVEKPPVLSLAELDDLIKAERGSSASAAVIFQHRFGPAAIRLRRLFESGELGRPLLATCATQWFRGEAYYAAAPWRGSWDSEGGGPTMGHGIHQFDLLLSVLGPWQEVTAVAARQARPTQTEDVSMALVTFANGALASVVNSVVSPRETSAIRFDFERATIEVEHLYGYTDADWTVTPAPGHDELAALWQTDSSQPPSNHRNQLLAVLDSMDHGEPLPVTLDDARDTMEFIAALYASAFSGQRVRRGDITKSSPFYRRMNGTGPTWATEGYK